MNRLALALAIIGLFVVSVVSATPAAHSVSYTSDQAWRGRMAYFEHCAECHGGGLEGQFGPALAGPDGRTQWESGKSVYAYITAQMPHGNPGALSTRDYVDIMAFLYQQHGRIAGSTPLTEAMSKSDMALLGP